MISSIRKTRGFLLAATLAVLTILLSGDLMVVGAQETVTDDPVQPPEQEKFVATDALAIPWRDGNIGCEYGSAVPTLDCPPAAGTAYPTSDVLVLYNGDGTLWYRFSVDWRSPIFWKDNKIGFVPFTNHFLFALRLVGESPHWYEVEVNEETGATKYILKSEPRMWSKVTWSFAFSASFSVKIDQEHGGSPNPPQFGPTLGSCLRPVPNSFDGSSECESNCFLASTRVCKYSPGSNGIGIAGGVYGINGAKGSLP